MDDQVHEGSQTATHLRTLVAGQRRGGLERQADHRRLVVVSMAAANADGNKFAFVGLHCLTGSIANGIAAFKRISGQARPSAWIG